MTNRLYLKWAIAAVIILIQQSVFHFLNHDRNIRINELLLQKQDRLQTHYKLATNSFKAIADANAKNIQQDSVVVVLLTKYLNASEEERALLRDALYKRVERNYKSMKELGVLQLHFSSPDNTTILRAHKQEEFGDSLEFRYGVRHVTQSRRAVAGFEAGKTWYSYRHIYPLFGENGIYLGAVDIAFTPEALQKNLLEESKLDSHLMVKKDVESLRKWSREDVDFSHVVSIEHSGYVELDSSRDEDMGFSSMISSLKYKLYSKIDKGIPFALYKIRASDANIIAFLPIRDIEQKVSAYLVSYTRSQSLYGIFMDFIIINTLVILGLLSTSIGFYRSVVATVELKEEKVRFLNLSQFDVLTKLPNLFLFSDRLNQSIEKSKRHGLKFAILNIDIDNFKQINDSFGRRNGDKALRTISSRLEGVLRNEDTLARIGGNEFGVILEDIKHPENILKVTNKISALFDDSLNIGRENFFINTSIGIAIFPDDSTNSIELLKYADVSVHNAKELGKNNVRFYASKMTKDVLEHITLEAQLRQAYIDREFVVHYQPQFDAISEEIIGMEALVRWRRGENDLIPPNKFIPLAEESGLIIDIDRLTMVTAMEQFNEWGNRGFKTGRLSLNLSNRQFDDKNIVHAIKKILFDTQFDPNNLELEVTESQAMRDAKEHAEVLKEFSDMGIKISIDDFGTGYSSLAYLRRLPIDKLKIDREFVNNITNSVEDQKIIKAILDLSDSLDLDVIAEGVETSNQLEFLKLAGCNSIQGYIFSKPYDSKKIEETFFLPKELFSEAI